MRSISLAIAAAILGMATVFLAVARAAEPANPKASSNAKANTKTKTIEEIAIEGEVRLPEVLFITSRDVERPIDWLEEYLLDEEAAGMRLDQAAVRLLVFPDETPVPDAAPEQSLDRGGEPLTPEREIEEESR